MSLFVPARRQMLDELNTINDGVATLSDIVFGTPEATTTEEKAAHGDRDSKVVITGVGAKYHGSTTVFYNRINLATPFANQMLLLEFHEPLSNLYAQLPLLNEQLASVFTEQDLEDFLFPAGQTEGLLPLTAKSGSLDWKGSATIGYRVAAPTALEIPDIHLDGVITPNDTTALEQAALRYSYWDFQLSFDVVGTLQPGPLSTQQITDLIAVFAEIDSTPWTATGPNEYCLEDATVEFNGSAAERGTSALFKNVVVIKLSNKSTLLTGELFLHYNNPEA